MSKRAELRRTQREEKRANTATYNLTQAQLDAIVSEKIGKKIAETKQEIYEETVKERLIQSRDLMISSQLSLLFVICRIFTLRNVSL